MVQKTQFNPTRLLQKPARLASSLLVGLCLILGGCTSALVVEAEFPNPVSNPIAITMGVVYPNSLTSYVYEETSDSRTRWIIDMGQAQENLFSQVFEPLFSKSIALANAQAAANEADLDLYLIPEISEFQYSSPRETRINVYEVWIKYHMQVYNPSGELVADWIMSAYGKTPSAFLQSREEAMNQAVVVALRDLGASLTRGFAKVPEIRAWLDLHQSSQPEQTLSMVWQVTR